MAAICGLIGLAEKYIERGESLMWKLLGIITVSGLVYGVLAYIMKIVGNIEWETIGKYFTIIGGMSALVFVIGLIPENKMKQATKNSLILCGIIAVTGIVMLSLINVLKLLEEIEWSAIVKLGTIIGGLIIIVASLSIFKLENVTSALKVLSIVCGMMLVLGIIMPLFINVLT